MTISKDALDELPNGVENADDLLGPTAPNVHRWGLWGTQEKRTMLWPFASRCLNR